MENKIRKIIIVDDSPVIQDRLEDIIDNFRNLQIIGQAKNVNESEILLDTLTPDLVILDIRIPGGSGIDILYKIKIKNKDIKVIVFTNYPYPQYRDICTQLGADYFFDKSTELKNILKVLKSMSNINTNPEIIE